MKTSFTVSWSSFDLTWFFFLDSSLQRQLCMYLNLDIEELIRDINLDRNYTLHHSKWDLVGDTAMSQ